MNQIKDQHKLFQKLFVCPTSTPSNPHLILSMQFLKLLLDEAPLLNPDAQKHLLLKILGLFEVQPVNSLLLYNHDSLAVGQTPLLTEIVRSCTKAITSRSQGQQCLTMFDSLLAYYPIGLLHISNITNQFAIQFQEGKFNHLRTWFMHKVLEKYYGPKRGLKLLPSSVFFFYGCTELSTIHSFEDLHIRLKNELSITFNFYLLDQLQQNIVMVRIRTSKEQLTIKLGKIIEVHNQTTNTKISQQQSLTPQIWHRIIINLSSNQTVIYLDDEQISRERPLIKRQKDRELLEYSFGQQFVGFITVIQPSMVKQFPKLKSWSDFNFVHKNSLEEMYVLCCLPFSTFDMRSATHCFDVFRKIHSQIGENIVVFRNVSEQAGIISLGGSQLLLPLFYLARFYDALEYPDHLQNILKIWLSSLTLYPNSQKDEHFLNILGHHLQSLPQLLTRQCIPLLNTIYQKHSLSNRTYFLRYVAWSGLPAKSTGIAATQWLNWLTKLYQNNKSQCLQAFGLMDVVYWLVIHLENNVHSCCPQHYLSQARVVRQFSLEGLGGIEGSSKRMHYQALQNIGGIILEYYLIDQHANTMKDLRGILRLLLHKYSACLYRTILRIFKRQFPKFKDDKALCHFLIDCEIVPFLAVIAQKTVDAGLLAIIVYLLLMLSKFQEARKWQAIDFLVIVFKRMEQIYQEPFNPIIHGVRKVRKQSAGSKQTQPFGDLLRKILEAREGMGQVAVLLLNYCVGVVSDRQLCKETNLKGEESFKLLRHFMPIADTKARILVLQSLLQKIQKQPTNIKLCSHSCEFSRILLGSIKRQGHRQTVLVEKIMMNFIQWQMTHHVRISQYFIFLKTAYTCPNNLTPFLCRLFHTIIQQQPSPTLQQLLMLILISTAEWQQAKTAACYQYKQMIRAIAPLIAQHLKHTFTISPHFSASLLLEQLSGLAPQMLDISFFNLQMNIITEQDITFLFDICLPKAAAGCKVDNLFQDTRRRVYAFEIVMWSMLQTLDETSQANEDLAAELVNMVKVFIASSILKNQLQIDKSFARMVLFATSQALCCSVYFQFYVQLWAWIIQLMKEQSIKFEAVSYNHLISKLSANKLQPFIVQIFQIFLRPSNDKYLLSFQQLQNNPPKAIVHFIQSDLKEVLQLQTMAYSIQSCKQYALGQLKVVFAGKVKSISQKMSSPAEQISENPLVREVEKLFQNQSIGEEQTRINYLHEYECSLRQYYSRWKKIWKRLRVYHHPYGLFMAQKDNINSFQFSNTQYKNFGLKISKFSSLTGVQPILQAQINQPWHVKKTIQRDAKHDLGSLGQMTRPSQNINKKQGISELATTLFRSIRGTKKKQEIMQYEVIWIKRGRKARGRLLVKDQSELVFWYDRLKQEDTHLSFQKFSLGYDKQMVKRWRIDLISKISLRRYLMQWHALEIQLLHQKSLLFYFCDHTQPQFLQQISAVRSFKLNQYGSRLKLNKIKFYSQNNWYEDQLPFQLTENWMNRKISTLQYLLIINQNASRNMLDISQYPVMPWVCQMAEDKQPVMRDLNKTMGSLGSEERKRLATQKYLARDPFNPVPPFFFGTHYSSPGVVFNYLIRLPPFTDYCKTLQGGRFDIADRLFASLITAWKSASSEVSDVREMIPEFYYLPELLLNAQKLQLGVTQSGDLVNHVELPPWAGDNPYFMVAQLRQMLQSEAVSVNIASWIDLLFGYKQKGKEAIDNFNVYYYLTYEDYNHILDNQKDQIYRKSCEAQIVHFGQIPPQLFQNPHPARKLHSKPLTELYTQYSIQLTNALTERPMGIYRTNDEVILMRRNQLQVLVAGKSPAIMTKCIELNVQRTPSKKIMNLKKQSGKCIFFNKYLLIYGYVTHEIRIFNRHGGGIQFNQHVESRIQFAVVNAEESLLLIGCNSGLLHIYEIEYEAQKVCAKLVQSLPFPHAVTHISEHDGFFAITSGCYVSIYKILRPISFLAKQPQKPFVRFFRSFYNNLPIKGAFIADSPLYCLLIYDNAHLKVYSINGQLIKSVNWSIRGMFRMVDSQLNSLFCIYEQGRLMLVSTPDLRCLSELQVGSPILVSEGIVIYKNRLDFISCLPS